MKVVFVMSDSYRRDHVGAHGNDWIRTPGLDRFAREAAVFETAVTGSMATIPNRTDHFTGRFSFADRPWQPLVDSDVVLAEVASKAGVPTMLINDTPHLGRDNHNFWRGFSAWHWNRGQEGIRRTLDASVEIDYPSKKHMLRLLSGGAYDNVRVNRQHRHRETDWFAPGTFSEAIHWLTRNHTRESFLLWIDAFDPHEPWDPPRWLTDLYDPGYKGEVYDFVEYGPADGLSAEEIRHTQALYAGECTMVDRWFGFLLDTIDLLGIAEDTAVFFTSDHGHYLGYPTDGGLVGKGLTNRRLPASSAKSSGSADAWTFDPHRASIVRIPLMIRLPGGRSAGSAGKRFGQVVQPCDTMPTILELLGVECPDTVLGRSLVPLLEKGPAAEWPRQRALTGCHRTCAQVRDGRYAYTSWWLDSEPHLYDLDPDPEETRNVAGEQREAALRLHGALGEELRAASFTEEQIAALRAPGK